MAPMATNRPPGQGPQIQTDPEQQYKIIRSQPDEIVRHDISDEELTALSDVRGDYLWEGKWVAAGVCLGVAPTTIQALFDSYWGENEQLMGLGEQVQVMIFIGSLVAFLLLWRVLRNKRRDAKELVEEIRKRTRRDVHDGARQVPESSRGSQSTANRSILQGARLRGRRRTIREAAGSDD